ncbi:MAG: NADH-quinone oxidoreductase subunit NuoF [Salinivirgaceae bacterium]|jgi:NADH-quinone oxidoreductase subunit F|nr:NADH-quinone oxidoreductase subunit NuoF [Salinivirgaceae bacterium]
MEHIQLTVDIGSSGIASGAGKVYDHLRTIVEKDNLAVNLKQTSGIGMCYKEPLLEVVDADGTYLYGDMTPELAEEVIHSHLKLNVPLKQYVVHSNRIQSDHNRFLDDQIRIALRNCGVIDPEKIDEYEQHNGYKAIQSILSENLSTENIIQTIQDSGLRGRGGGGFPTGLKWKFAANNVAIEKYIICNADEGDPGAFMDRSLLEGDPHAVLEGMIIGARAMGATAGVIYCRAEYPLAIKRLNIAIHQAREKGYLGKNIFGVTGFDFNINVKEGAGAFVCGEETALIASIEGKRGMPRKRPPFPAASGLWNKPSNINNVETLANIPWIIQHGASAYAQYGTEKSKGTKVFALAGKINRGGLVEVPMGISLEEVVNNLGGGVPNNKKLKAVQLGGPSGGCIPEHLMHTKVDYESVTATGAIMGSGGLVVMDEDTCMVDVARFFLDFTRKESCGKCTFCRVGTKRMLEILTGITEGKGVIEDIDKLLELGEQIKKNSLCGLGQTAPNPVLTTIKYFRDEYEAHIIDKKCPAAVCKQLLHYEIIEDKCTGCTVCAKVCPTNAISGERKQVHYIDQEKCIQCGECFNKCNFDAISVS